MACERNRILELKEYLSSIGIDVNIGKTKARGHNGIFMHGRDSFRIDISRNLNPENILSVLLHEYAHYVHYSYDSKLKSLDFVFGTLTDEMKEELIVITVDEVPKDFAKTLYSNKEKLTLEIKKAGLELKKYYPDLKLSKPCKLLEKNIPNPFKYLLKYDRVKYFDKIYSIEDAKNDTNILPEQISYIKLKTLQRGLRRINSKISRLNGYYNNPSELFARFVSLYYTNPEKVKKLAPVCYEKFYVSDIPLLKKIEPIFNIKDKF